MCTYICLYVFPYIFRYIECSPRDQGLIPGHVIPKIQEIVRNACFLNNQHYKVGIKSRIEKYKDMSYTPNSKPTCSSY